ncbi:hypothetical protein FHL15_006571 [Xylaria flabelliformis]|uniref:Uncharacterized protein n=1 Tax=Xylaria flabelliformis TaxID=2512241 RepID=A0A553HXG6_9PEZI|nr:hypothetical protein FHL15_006571 [Xylaria flabelliformis]
MYWGSAPILWSMVTIVYQKATSGERTARVKTRQIRTASTQIVQRILRVTTATLCVPRKFSIFTNGDKAARP